jgi:AraC-like DNA-binding protein
VEERIEALQEAWQSFLIEFPTYPKIFTRGKDVSQQVLFLCPLQEENPTDLCLALFGSQILINTIQYSAPPESLAGARFLFLYANDAPPESLWDMVSLYLGKVSTPVLVARKSNVLRTAQLVTDYLSRGMVPAVEESPRPWSGAFVGTEPARVEGSLPTMTEEATLWQEGLPEITIVDEEGRAVRAIANLQDYRAEYACRYVLAHFQENINRDKMAEMVNLSPGYFSNLFRSEVGMSFSDYLIQVRIENAKRLLRRFDLSVEAISKQCGFNSLAHFSRTFKDRCSLSPLKYRKNPNSQA